ncbi:pumilio [Anaeramoeba flamelloides]|uniref:Pumilio n=1 Tax=Anaeramoeba flamelloides TaxID=1746091 RepID=A0AAV7ZIH3_9EUKA|nr:pumilio [Anaeramoeba flamelloides]
MSNERKRTKENNELENLENKPILKKKRKNNDDESDELEKEVLTIWSENRSKKINLKKKQEAIDEILEKLKGNLPKLVRKRPISRVIQFCLKNGTRKQKNAIKDEIIFKALKIGKDRYGKFVLMQMLPKLDKDEIQKLLKRFQGKITKVCCHRYLSEVFNEIFPNKFSEQQVKNIISEFYGKEYTNNKNNSLSELLEAFPKRRIEIMSFVKHHIKKIVSKELVQQEAFHHVLREYVDVCNDREMQTLCVITEESFINLIHTKKGAYVATKLITYFTPKQRKMAVKSISEYVPKLSKDKFGYFILCKLLSCVDDTVLLTNNILKKFENILKESCLDFYASKVLLLIISKEIHRQFSKENLAQLQNIEIERTKKTEDGIVTEKVRCSKKDDETRKQELAAFITKRLINISQENASEFILSQIGSQIIFELFKTVQSESIHPVYDKMTEIVLLKNIEYIEILNHSYGHRVIKQLIRLAPAFGAYLEKSLLETEKGELKKILTQLINSRGVFILLALVERKKCKKNLKQLIANTLKRLNLQNINQMKGVSILKRKVQLK